MPSGELKVTFGALDATAGDVQGAANQIQGRLDQLDSDLAPLRTDWTGDAQQAYEQAKAEWTRAMTDMQALLAQIGTAVSQSNSDYQTAERANQSRWG
jgi:WXG100 family type VII secretion target